MSSINSVLEQTLKEVQDDKKLPASIRNLSDPLDALTALAKTQNTKYVTTKLSCFNRVLSNDTLPDAVLTNIITSLIELSKTSSDVQLRVLQLLPLFFKPGKMPSDGHLSLLFQIPTALLKVPGIVSNIAGASLQQILVGLFENPPASREASASRVFEDLCSSFSGHATGLVSFRDVKVPLLLEIIESVLDSGSRLLHDHPSLVNANLLPSLIESIEEWSSFVILVRVMRIVKLLLPLRLVLVETLVALISDNDQRTILILEVFEACISQLSEQSVALITRAMLSIEAQIPLLGTYMISAPPTRIEEVNADGLIYSEKAAETGIGEWCEPAKRLIAQLNSPDAPGYSVSYKFLLMLRIINGVSERPQHIWRDLLTLHSAFLSCSLSLQLEQLVLDTTATTIVALDSMDEKRPRNLFIRRLGRIATTSSLIDVENPFAEASTGELSHRSLSCLDTFLYTIIQLRNNFDLSAWLQILEILYSAESSLSFTTRSKRHGSTVASGDNPPPTPSLTTSEVTRIAIEIQNFFQSSDQIQEQSFAALIEALCSLQQETPSTPSIHTPGNSRVNSPILTRNTSSFGSISNVITQVTRSKIDFALEKLRELLPSNTLRFLQAGNSAWKVLFEHLAIEIGKGNIIAAEIVGLMIEQGVQYGLETEEQRERYIRAITLIQGEGQIQIIQLQTLVGILETMGHDIASGWDLILLTLHSAVSLGPMTNSDAVKLGFTSLQLICDNFLPSVMDQKDKLIDTIVGFCSQRASFQISLSAVAQFWIVLDSLPTTNDFGRVYVQFSDESSREEEHLWLHFMESLIHVAQDPRLEIRNSAVQVCFRTIERMEDLGVNAWVSSIHLILQELHRLAKSALFDSEDYVNAITSGTGHTMQVFDMLVRSGSPTLLWEILSSHFVTILDSSMPGLIHVALGHLKDIFEGLTTTTIDVWESNWLMMRRDILNNDLSQESVALYVNCIQLISHAMKMDKDSLKLVLDILEQALKFYRSSTYYLDVDYLSTVQKSVLSTLEDLIKLDPILVTNRSAAWLALAPDSVDRTVDFVHIRATKGKWTGIPSYIAFTYELMTLIHDNYHHETLNDLIRPLNHLIATRYSRSSISNTNQYCIWQSATHELLHFLSQGPLPDTIWPKLMETSQHLFFPCEDQSEEFVQASLNTFRAIITPKLDRSGLTEEYATHLARGSWFHPTAEVCQPTSQKVHYYKDELIREWCLLELLRLSVSPESTICAHSALPHTIKRAQCILRRYTGFAAIRAHAPLAYQERLELETLLHHLADDIHHENQQALLKNVYKDLVECLLMETHGDSHLQLMKLLKAVLLKIADFL